LSKNIHREPNYDEIKDPSIKQHKKAKTFMKIYRNKTKARKKLPKETKKMDTIFETYEIKNISQIIDPISI
jgi:hypothetical protein